MLILPTNKPSFFGRFVLLALPILFAYVVSYHGMEKYGINWVYTVCFVILLSIPFVIALVDSLISINKVEINTTTGVIIFSSMRKKKTIAAEDIKGYFVTVLPRGYKGRNGLLLRLANDETVQLSGQNVLRLQDLKQFMDEKKIVCLGTKRTRFPFN